MGKCRALFPSISELYSGIALVKKAEFFHQFGLDMRFSISSPVRDLSLDLLLW